MAVNIPGLIAVIIFYLMILAIGLWTARKTKTSNNEDLMLAGRSIGLAVGMFTMTGGFFFAKRMRSQGYVTMLDPLQQKYGDKMGALLYLPPLTGEIFWSGAILGALGTTLAVIIDLNYEISVIISASIAVFYTLFGGLYSVAYTDVVQLIFICVGLWLSVPFAMTHDAVRDISVNYTTVWIKEIDPKQSGAYIDYALLLCLGGIGWQVYFQRVLSAKSTRIAETVSYLAGLGCLFLTIPAILIGAIAAQTNWNETTYHKATSYGLPAGDSKFTLPLVIQYLCPTAVSFFGLGAVAAAVMSSADSSVLSASSMFSRNIYKVLIRPQASDKELLWVMRVAIICVGAISTILAIQVGSIYELFVLCSDFVFVMLFPQLTCVVYFEGTNTYGSLAGFLTGLFFRLAGGEKGMNLPALIHYPWYNATENKQLFPFKTFAMLVTFVFIFTISYLTRFLFEKEYLSKKADIFKCIVNTQQDIDRKDVLFHQISECDRKDDCDKNNKNKTNGVEH